MTVIGKCYPICTHNRHGRERLFALARELDTSEITGEIRYFGNLGLIFLGLSMAVLVVAVF